MGKKKEPYIIVTFDKDKKTIVDSTSHEKRIGKKKLRRERQRQNLRVLGKERRKTVSEKDGGYSIYTGSFFELSSRTSRRKPNTLEIILLIDRIETDRNSSTIISIEEWNARSSSRTLIKRYFYKENGEWKPGKSTGFTYLDLEHIFKQTKEGQRIRREIMELLNGPIEE